jgi:hypothetical protein
MTSEGTGTQTRRSTLHGADRDGPAELKALELDLELQMDALKKFTM